MSILHVHIADIYQTISTLNNPKTPTASFGVLVLNYLIIHAFYQ
jgi:hypothetical protein